jgi:protein TonB
MFDAVLNRADGPKSRFGVGTAISVAVHVGLLGLALWLSSRPTVVHEPDPEVKFFAAMPVAPPPPPPPPPAPTKTAKKVEKKVTPKPTTLVQPKEIPEAKPPEAEPQPEASSDEAGQEGGVEGGVKGGVVGGVVGGTVGGTLGSQGTDVVPFGEGMTRPECDKVELARNLYTREALEAQVEGMMIVRCHILADGTVRNCRVIKPLPHLSEAVVAKLQSMTCKPGTFQGKPISIDYVLNFQFKMPR